METYSEIDLNIYVRENSHLLRVSIDIVWKIEWKSKLGKLRNRGDWKLCYTDNNLGFNG